MLLRNVPQGSPSSELTPGCHHPPVCVLGMQVTPEHMRRRRRPPFPVRRQKMCCAGPRGDATLGSREGSSCQGCEGALAPSRHLPTGLHPTSRCALGVLQPLAKEPGLPQAGGSGCPSAARSSGGASLHSRLAGTRG